VGCMVSEKEKGTSFWTTIEPGRKGLGILHKKGISNVLILGEKETELLKPMQTFRYINGGGEK